jgi:hypothetical protein
MLKIDDDARSQILGELGEYAANIEKACEGIDFIVTTTPNYFGRQRPVEWCSSDR